MKVICNNARKCNLKCGPNDTRCGHQVLHDYNECICNHACTDTQYKFGNLYKCIEVKYV